MFTPVNTCNTRDTGEDSTRYDSCGVTGTPFLSGVWSGLTRPDPTPSIPVSPTPTLTPSGPSGRRRRRVRSPPSVLPAGLSHLWRIRFPNPSLLGVRTGLRTSSTARPATLLCLRPRAPTRLGRSTPSPVDVRVGDSESRVESRSLPRTTRVGSRRGPLLPTPTAPVRSAASRETEGSDDDDVLDTLHPRAQEGDGRGGTWGGDDVGEEGWGTGGRGGPSTGPYRQFPYP